MQMTFMIGNGFDLACGLNTRFTDVYKEYCSPSSIEHEQDTDIKDFKKTILGKGNYENWSDFEMALPEFGKQINNFDKFEKCVLNFADYLNDYLKRQENRLEIEKEKIGTRAQEFFYKVQNYCLVNSKTALGKRIAHKSEDCLVHFITFNYTNTLEALLTCVQKEARKFNSSYSYRYENPIHIHSTLDKGILLGLDNEELYECIPCSDKRRLKNLIDKLYNNERRSNITNNAVSVLQSSEIIVILGWSMGESDSFWVETIRELFAKNKSLQLVYIPYYKEALNPKVPSQQLNREDESQDIVVEKLLQLKSDSATEADRARIHIVTDDSYMALPFLAKEIQEDTPENVYANYLKALAVGQALEVKKDDVEIYEAYLAALT